MPFQRNKVEARVERPGGGRQGETARVAEFMRMTQEMDRETLVLSLAALNSSLRDALPDDRTLRRDLSEVRLQLMQRKLDVGGDHEEIQSVVHRHVHVHLWDEGTREKVAQLGQSVVDFARRAMQAAEDFVEADRRATQKLGEAAKEFYAAFSGMVDFLRPGGELARRATPRGAEQPVAQQNAADIGSSDERRGVAVATDRPSAQSLAQDMMKAIEEVCDTAEERIVVVRVMAAAMGQPLDHKLEEVRNEAPEVVSAEPAASQDNKARAATEEPAQAAPAPAKKKFRFTEPQPEPVEPEDIPMGFGPEPG